MQEVGRIHFDACIVGERILGANRLERSGVYKDGLHLSRLLKSLQCFCDTHRAKHAVADLRIGEIEIQLLKCGSFESASERSPNREPAQRLDTCGDLWREASCVVSVCVVPKAPNKIKILIRDPLMLRKCEIGRCRALVPRNPVRQNSFINVSASRGRQHGLRNNNVKLPLGLIEGLVECTSIKECAIRLIF